MLDRIARFAFKAVVKCLIGSVDPGFHQKNRDQKAK